MRVEKLLAVQTGTPVSHPLVEFKSRMLFWHTYNNQIQGRKQANEMASDVGDKQTAAALHGAV